MPQSLDEYTFLSTLILLLLMSGIDVGVLLGYSRIENRDTTLEQPPMLEILNNLD